MEMNGLSDTTPSLKMYERYNKWHFWSWQPSWERVQVLNPFLSNMLNYLLFNGYEIDINFIKLVLFTASILKSVEFIHFFKFVQSTDFLSPSSQYAVGKAKHKEQSCRLKTIWSHLSNQLV